MLERLDVVHQQDAARLGDVQPLVGVDGGREGAVEAFEQVAGSCPWTRRGGRRRRRRGARRRRRRPRRGPRCRRPRRSASCRRWRRPPPGSRRSVGLCRSLRAHCGYVHPSVLRRSGSRGRCARRCRGPRRRGGPSSAPRPSSTAPSCGRRRRRGGRREAARSRAAVSAVRFAIVPPAASSPQALSSNPTNCPTQRIVCASSRSAAPALFATLTSCEAISASARTPISRPEDPMYANQRGRACASERSSTSAAASSDAVRVRRRCRERAAQQLAGVLVGERLARSGVVEAPPRVGDQLGGVLENVLAVGKREGRALGRASGRWLMPLCCQPIAAVAPAGRVGARELQ